MTIVSCFSSLGMKVCLLILALLVINTIMAGFPKKMTMKGGKPQVVVTLRSFFVADCPPNMIRIGSKCEAED